MKQYKHASVIDCDGYYVDFVLVVETDVVSEDGTTRTEWVVQHYTLNEGETLVDVKRPHARIHAGDEGIIVFKWDGTQWIEGATSEEIDQWEQEHPVPEVTEIADPIGDAIEEGLLYD